MSVENRLKRIEGAVFPSRPGGLCGCRGGGFECRYYDGGRREADEDKRPAEACGVCGLPRLLIRVVYVPSKAELEEWQRAHPGKG